MKLTCCLASSPRSSANGQAHVTPAAMFLSARGGFLFPLGLMWLQFEYDLWHKYAHIIFIAAQDNVHDNCKRSFSKSITTRLESVKATYTEKNVQNHLFKLKWYLRRQTKANADISIYLEISLIYVYVYIYIKREHSAGIRRLGFRVPFRSIHFLS